MPFLIYLNFNIGICIPAFTRHQVIFWDDLHYDYTPMQPLRNYEVRKEIDYVCPLDFEARGRKSRNH